MNFKTKLDRNKHNAYHLVTLDESSSGKENKLFRFGVTGKKSMGREVFIVEEDMYLKKPLDIEPTNHDQPTVGILEAMEGIIQAIENSY